MKMLKLPATVLAVLILALVSVSSAHADGTVTWGVSGVTPTLNTANGDYADSRTPGVVAGGACPHGESCGSQVNPFTKANPILPAPSAGEDRADDPHVAEDLAVWNQGIVAPTGGQVLDVRLTGCAVEDTAAPSQLSQTVPVNTVLFQTLRPAAGGWSDTQVSNAFTVPFCHNAVNGSSATAATVTTYQPIRMCVGRGDAIALHDIGGFVEGNGQSYYPQGVPLEVLAPINGQSTASFIGVGPDVYGPGAVPSSGLAGAGYATEADQEVTMQIVESTGNDAYDLCPGGFAYEPQPRANTISCVFRSSGSASHTVNPVKDPDHPFCGADDKPVAGSNSPAGAGGGHVAPAVAPRITHLGLNPPLFVARVGATITYRDSEPGLATLRIYRVTGTTRTLVATIHHRDRVNAGLHLSGLAAGSYLLSVSSVYRGKVSQVDSTRFTVIARR